MANLWQKITGKKDKSETEVVQAPEAVEHTVSEGEAAAEHTSGKNIQQKVHQVGDKVTDVADVVVDQSKKIGKAVASKTGEAVTFGRLKLKLYNQQHQLDKLFGKLGGTAYGLIKSDAAVLDHDDIQTLVGEIEDLQKEIEVTKAELDEQPE